MTARNGNTSCCLSSQRQAANATSAVPASEGSRGEEEDENDGAGLSLAQVSEGELYIEYTLVRDPKLQRASKCLAFAIRCWLTTRSRSSRARPAERNKLRDARSKDEVLLSSLVTAEFVADRSPEA